MFLHCAEAHIRLLALVMAPTRELAIQIHGACITLVMCVRSCDDSGSVASSTLESLEIPEFASARGASTGQCII